MQLGAKRTGSSWRSILNTVTIPHQLLSLGGVIVHPNGKFLYTIGPDDKGDTGDYLFEVYSLDATTGEPSSTGLVYRLPSCSRLASPLHLVVGRLHSGAMKEKHAVRNTQPGVELPGFFLATAPSAVEHVAAA